MKQRASWIALATLAGLLIACGGGGNGADSLALVVAAGNQRLAASSNDSWASSVDLGRLGLDGVDGVWDLTTPAGERFSFDLMSRTRGNAGRVRVSVAHAEDGGVPPLTDDAESIAEAGVTPSASGATVRGRWVDAWGDGFSRVTLRGAIERDQVFAVEVDGGRGVSHALVRVRVGPPSPINPDLQAEDAYPDVTQEATIYSSDSWRFGLPTAAVSGDRTSVVVYEGDRGDPQRFSRFEMRLQVDHDTGTVTGGASQEVPEDYGHWRDHEIAALYNVLAVVRSSDSGVVLQLSYDRGATFAQTEHFAQPAGVSSSRLVQIAMAADYSLALLYWRGRPDDSSTDLVLIEGRPSEFDLDGSPTRFEFDPAYVVFSSPGALTPLLMGATWSEGGDLVIGYGFTQFLVNPDRTWTNLSQFRCTLRPYQGTWRHALVDESVVIGKDPSVAVLGSGPTMRIFFAYEATTGIRLRASGDGGATWGVPIDFGGQAAHMPQVFARPGDGTGPRVDVVYLDESGAGNELHLRHWDDFDAGGPADYRLTRAEIVEADTLPPDVPVPGAPLGTPPPDIGMRLTQVGWLGYDAVLDGNEIVVVYDEETFFDWVFLMEVDFLGAPTAGGGGVALPGADSGGFEAAEPPPLAPGLTEPVPPPDPDHMHQLKLLRLG